MFTKGKGPQSPSDAQAKEKLAQHVYEYLIHIGAQKSAHTFLSEIRWDKPYPLSISEPPGFLLSWWCVFWDLYSAAPERRDTHEHSNEAKAFHDFFINSGGYSMPNGMPNNQAMNPMGAQMGPQDNMAPNNSMPPQPGPYYNPNAAVPMPPSNPQTSSNPMMMSNQYNRFQRPMRVGSNDFTGANNVPPMGMEGGRVPPGMNPMNRLTPPGARMQGAPNQVPPSAMSQMASFNSPNSSQQQGPPGQVPPQQAPPQQQQPGPPVPGPPQQQPPQQQMRGPLQGPSQSQLGPPQMPPNNAAMSPMPMSMANAQSRWPGGPPSVAPSQITYSSPSPVPYPPHGPGTPIMQSPQEANNEVSYGMMKGMPGNMGYHEPNLSHMVPMNSDMHHQQQMNGEIMDCMKSSPIGNMSANCRGQEDLSNTAPMNDMSQYGHFGEGPVQTDSDAILKLKESIQQVAKRYEKTNEQQNEYQ